jgi:hypothetical protein
LEHLNSEEYLFKDFAINGDHPSKNFIQSHYSVFPIEVAKIRFAKYLKAELFKIENENKNQPIKRLVWKSDVMGLAQLIKALQLTVLENYTRKEIEDSILQIFTDSENKPINSNRISQNLTDLKSKPNSYKLLTERLNEELLSYINPNKKR